MNVDAKMYNMCTTPGWNKIITPSPSSTVTVLPTVAPTHTGRAQKHLPPTSVSAVPVRWWQQLATGRRLLTGRDVPPERVERMDESAYPDESWSRSKWM